MGEQQETFNAEHNIERIVSGARDVKVHGKFPRETTIRGTPIKQIDPGGFTTINVSDGTEQFGGIYTPEQLNVNKNRDFVYNWDDAEENQNTCFFSLTTFSDKNGNKVNRVLLTGIEQPNKAINDSRMAYETVNIYFQFELYKEEFELFLDLFIKDRKSAPRNIQKLLERMYEGLISTEETKYDKDRIIMKPIERVVVVDRDFKTNGAHFVQTNPNRIFPPPPEFYQQKKS